jgi:hypothetical protein
MRPTRVLLAVSAAALVATACGDDSTSAAAPSQAAGSAGSSAAAASPSAAGGDVAALAAPEIFARTKAAFKKADTVRLTGSGASGTTKFAIDMRYATAGDAVGTVTNAGETIELRRVGQTIYVKADKAFWTKSAGAAVGELLGGKYLKAPLTDQRVAQLGAFTDKNSFADEVLSPSNTVTKGDTKTIRGIPAIGLVDKSSSGSATLYVATTGEPVPLQLAPTAGAGNEGSFDFLDYGKPVDVAAPPAAQTVDSTKLTK